MLKFRLSALLLSFSLIGFPAAAQQIPTPSQPSGAPIVQRDAQALAIVQSSVAAMGGSGAVAQVQNCVVVGASVNAAPNSTAAVSFTWSYAGAEFRLENDAGASAHITVSNGGSPKEFHDGSWFPATPMSARTNLPYHVPALVLFNELNDPSYSIMYSGSAALNGIRAIHIITRDDSDAVGHVFTQQDWYFDPTTGLPIAVDYQQPISSGQPQASMNFSDYKIVGGVLVPFNLQIAEGPASIVANVTTVTFNTNIDPTVFAPPSGSVQ